MAKQIKTIIKIFFFKEWERKLLSLLLSVAIWIGVNRSLTITKVLDNVSVHIINIPEGMTVVGIQPNGKLSKTISISIQGNKSQISEINSADLELVIDAKNQKNEWVAPISLKQLCSLNSAIDLSKIVKKVGNQSILISLTQISTEKIPVTITHPIGELPSGYQWIEIWPRHLFVTVSGPLELVRSLQKRGVDLTFNLNNLSSQDFDSLHNSNEEFSYAIPDQWKKVEIPSLSTDPFYIDDPRAKELNIDIIKDQLYLIKNPIPILLFFPYSKEKIDIPKQYFLERNKTLLPISPTIFLEKKIYIGKVSKLFAQLVENRLAISILLPSHESSGVLDWAVELIDSRSLEEKYISLALSKEKKENDRMIGEEREEHCRRRFRNYMKNFALYRSAKAGFKPEIYLEENKIIIQEER